MVRSSSNQVKASQSGQGQVKDTSSVRSGQSRRLIMVRSSSRSCDGEVKVKVRSRSVYDKVNDMSRSTSGLNQVKFWISSCQVPVKVKTMTGQVHGQVKIRS